MVKTTKQIQVGDTMKVWWRPGWDRVTELKRYRGPLLETLGEGTMLASFALNPTGMTLEAGALHECKGRVTRFWGKDGQWKEVYEK